MSGWAYVFRILTGFCCFFVALDWIADERKGCMRTFLATCFLMLGLMNWYIVMAAARADGFKFPFEKTPVGMENKK